MRKYASSDAAVCRRENRWIRLLSVLPIFAFAFGLQAADEKPAASAIPIARVKGRKTIDFEKEILPILRSKCLACHSESKAESDLVLENPASIRKGGESGPAVVPKKPGQSLLLQLASHQKKPFMPPPRNKAAALPLSSEELGLIQLWIEQGAKGEVRKPDPIHWQPVPISFAPIYSVALGDFGQLAVCGRGNRLFIYHVPTGELQAELVDPDFKGAHRTLIQSVTFSPDGQRLASGAFREVKIWRKINGESGITGSLEKPVQSAAFAAGKLAVATADSIQVREASSRKVLREWKQTGVRKLIFSTDANRLISLGAGGCQVWDSEQGKLAAAIPETSPIRDAVFVEGSTRLATAHEDGIVRLWGSGPGASPQFSLQKEWKAHEGPVTALAASEPWIASGGEDKLVRVWNKADGSELKKLDHGAPVRMLAASGETKRLASAGEGTSVRLWNTGDWEAMAELKGDRAAIEAVGVAERRLGVATLDLSFWKNAASAAQKEQGEQTNRLAKAVDARKSATAAFDEKKKAVDAAKAALAAAEKEAEAVPAEPADKKKAAQEKAAAAKKPIEGLEKEFKKAELAKGNADNEHDLAAKAVERVKEQLETAGKSVTAAEQAMKAAEIALKEAKDAASRSETPARWIGFSSNGKWLFSGGGDGAMRAWSGITGQALATYASGSGAALSAEVIDGSVVSISNSGAIRGWPLKSEWKLERRIGTGDIDSPISDQVNCIDWSPAGDRIAIASGQPSRSGQIQIWEASTGRLWKELRGVHSDSVFAVQFSPDGKSIASGSADKFAKIVDLEKGAVTRALEGHTHYVFGVSWRRDGRMIATAGGDSLLKTWDVASGERKANVSGFNKQATSAHYLAASDEILGTSGDAQVRLVSESGGEVRAFSGASDYIYAGAVSPDGRWIVGAGQDGVLRVWNAKSGDLLEQFPAR